MSSGEILFHRVNSDRAKSCAHLGDLGKRELPAGGFPGFGSGEIVKVIGISNCPRVPGFTAMSGARPIRCRRVYQTLSTSTYDLCWIATRGVYRDSEHAASLTVVQFGQKG